MARPADAALTRRLSAHGQEHLLRFWDAIDDAGRDRLEAQIEKIDLDLVDRLVATQLRADGAADAGTTPVLEPAAVIGVPTTDAERAAEAEARATGEALIRDGKVAVLTVAGGQGSRLGFDGPKGAFAIGPVSGRTLFELFARQIGALRRRYHSALPWLVMTSEANHAETTAFFAAHDWFGLGSDSIHFFTQGMVPSVDMDGKILLAAPDRVAMNPDGHGGTLLALRYSGALADLEDAGIELIHYFQVDNPLVAIADPVFLGHHRGLGAEMSSKAVEKTGPDEKVGVFARVNGRIGVIEYSDLDTETAARRNLDGSLVFGAGSIAIHVLSTDFVARLTAGDFSLPYHKALKKVAHVDAEGFAVEPAVPNAVKFETFIFDALAEAGTVVTQMVRREDEFSPVKNADGVDSVATAKAAIAARAWRWLAQAGAVTAPMDAECLPAIEIDPGFALDAGELRERLPDDYRPTPETLIEG